MDSRKLKGVKQEPPTPVTPSELVPYSSPVSISSRFTTIGQLRPNYQSALVNSYDPFAVTTQTQSTGQPSVRYPATSPYLPKNSSQSNLFYIEPLFSKYKTPEEIAGAWFPPGHHYAPNHPSKTLKYYRDILFSTESILIKPIKDKNDQSKIIFHSMYILKIMSHREWASRPSTIRILPTSNDPYTYYDYIDAWHKIFLHQNESFSHSWFINFDRKFNGQFPVWFQRWWDCYGAIFDLFPNQLRDTVKYFKTVFKVKEEGSPFPILLHFMAKYKVPWILKWHYGRYDDIITRTFLVKWWDKFNHIRIIEQVTEEFPLVKTPSPKVTASPVPDSLQLSGKSKEELQALANSILAEVTKLEASEKADSEGSTSSSPACSSKLQSYHDYYQDAQDPFE